MKKIEDIDNLVPKKKGYKVLIILLVAIIICVAAIFIWGPWKTTPVSENVTDNLVLTINTTETNTLPIRPQGGDCGDGVCGLAENYSVCTQDCIINCGNGIILPDDGKNWKNCRQDLLSKCGNGVCNEWEAYRYCPQDCTECIVDDLGKYDGPNECPPSPRWVQ